MVRKNIGMLPMASDPPQPRPRRSSLHNGERKRKPHKRESEFEAIRQAKVPSAIAETGGFQTAAKPGCVAKGVGKDTLEPRRSKWK
jgi:hypothetical protein